MYAIIRAGGKQYKVQPGDTLRVEKLEAELGTELELTDVLLVGGEKTFIGEPTLQDAKVTVVVTQQAKAPKVIIFKKKRRQGYRRMAGHRQMFTELFVKSITSPEGQTNATDKQAKIFNPEKRLEKQARSQATRAMKKAVIRETGVTPETKKAAPKAKKKKVVKKAATKTKAKKSSGKKKVVKKKATTKKA